VSLHGDLLAQAGNLVVKEPKRPKQASLRRAVSAAYYALFHLLTDASSRFMVSGEADGRAELRQAIRRSYAHGDMKSAAKSFASGAPARVWTQAAGAVGPDIVTVAETFLELQEARHDADYDHVRAWKRREALDLVRRAEEAFTAWKRASGSRDASTFLVALLAKARNG